MLRYQSEITAALEKEYLKVFCKQTAYYRSGPNRDIVLYREFLAYETALHVHFNWAVELDRKTNPKKYSGLRLSARRLLQRDVQGGYRTLGRGSQLLPKLLRHEPVNDEIFTCRHHIPHPCTCMFPPLFP